MRVHQAEMAPISASARWCWSTIEAASGKLGTWGTLGLRGAAFREVQQKYVLGHIKPRCQEAAMRKSRYHAIMLSCYTSRPSILAPPPSGGGGGTLLELVSWSSSSVCRFTEKMNGPSVLFCFLLLFFFHCPAFPNSRRLYYSSHLGTLGGRGRAIGFMAPASPTGKPDRSSCCAVMVVHNYCSWLCSSLDIYHVVWFSIL